MLALLAFVAAALLKVNTIVIVGVIMAGTVLCYFLNGRKGGKAA